MANEKSLKEVLVLKANDLDGLGDKENLTFKILMEENRYRQDCRKKAMEIAETQHNGDHDYFLKVADKYYNWLISIPETK